MPNRTWKLAVFAFASVSLSAVVSLLFAECALRLWRPQPGVLFPAGTTDFDQAPKARWYGWAHVPGSSVEVRDPDSGRTFVQHFNSQGWHDVEHPIAKPAGRLRILVLGDSFTQGYVPLGKLYTRKLEALLREAGLDVEVISMGQGGFSTDQELEVLLREGRHYQPDWVILQYYNNDDLANFQPFRERADRPRPAGKTPNFRWPNEHKLFRYDRVRGNLEKRDFMATASRNPPLLYAANRVLLRAMRASSLVHHVVMSTHSLGWTSLYAYDTFLDRRKLPERDSEPKAAKLIGLIELVNELCEKIGARLAVFALDMQPATLKFLKSKAAGRFHLISPTQAYARLQNDPYDHTNAKGNRQMARDLANFVLDAMQRGESRNKKQHSRNVR